MQSDARWRDLSTLLTDLSRRNGPFKLVPNRGNAGDALIETGQWQFFDAHGWSPALATRRQVRRGDNVLYAGGGNLVPEYRACAKFLAICLDAGVASAVVLPHTIRGHEQLLGRLDSRFTLVCRDRRSLAWAGTHAPRARVMFAPDMALYIDPVLLFRRCEAREVGRAMARQNLLNFNLLRYAVWKRRIRAIRPGGDGVLTIFRTDVESRAELAGKPSMDLSNLYGSGYLSRAECDLVSRDFLATLDEADTIVTNRLHVGIGAVLLGKTVRLYDNSYGKIGDVYESSLRGYPAVSIARAPASMYEMPSSAQGAG